MSTRLNELLKCPNCKGDITDNMKCEKCQYEIPVSYGMYDISSKNVNVINSEYEKETKNKYKTDEYAEDYLGRYADSDILNIRHVYSTIITRRERKTIDKCLDKINSNIINVLDMPAGTGKLSVIHKEKPYSVYAADVSPNMLKAGQKEWDKINNYKASIVADALKTNFCDKAFDATICLRLAHRLPKELRLMLLKELQRITKKYLIISVGIKKNVVTKIFETKRDHPTEDELYIDLREIGEIKACFNVLPMISTEKVFLIEVK